MDYAFQYVEGTKLETEGDYPYTARDGSCHFDSSKGKVSVKGYADVPQSQPEQLMAAVAQQPVSVAIEADTDVF